MVEYGHVVLLENKKDNILPFINTLVFFVYHLCPGGVVKYLYCIHRAGAGYWIGCRPWCGTDQCGPQDSVVSIWPRTLYLISTQNSFLFALFCEFLSSLGSMQF